MGILKTVWLEIYLLSASLLLLLLYLIFTSLSPVHIDTKHNTTPHHYLIRTLPFHTSMLGKYPVSNTSFK